MNAAEHLELHLGPFERDRASLPGVQVVFCATRCRRGDDMRRAGKAQEAQVRIQSALMLPYRERRNLIRVTGRFWHDASIDQPLLVELVLGFEGTEVTLAVTEEDEIDAASRVSAEDPAVQEVDLADVVPWSGTIGRPLKWFWEMTNHQGYSDGVQLEFSKDAESESVIVQLIALGAQLRVREIDPRFFRWPR